MTSTDMLARWSIDSGDVAPRKSSWETPRMKEYTAKYPQALTARDQLQYALAELPVKNIIEVKRAIVTAYQTALTNPTQPLGPILADGQKRIDEILK
jgi:sn-glycerol 3-phosphate transport system substrate-binding protein